MAGMQSEHGPGTTRRRVMLGLGAAGASIAMLGAGRAQDATPSARVTGPIRGGRHGWPFAGFVGDLAAMGYVEEEFFLEGESTRYSPGGPLSDDGRWSVVPAGRASFKTRVLVRRPRDAARFNGTVVLEWLNVSNGYDLATMGLRPNGLYTEGFAFAMVSCQVVGHQGFQRAPQGLKIWDPQRYGTLSIAGDSHSYDIFSHAGRALGPHRDTRTVDPMGGLGVRKIIATGASQSAARLRTYMNAVHPGQRVFDAFVPLIDFCRATGFDDLTLDPTMPSSSLPGPLRLATRIRSDLSTPVMVVNTQTETLAYLRQPDSDHFRFWEIAGASHAPAPAAHWLRAVWKRDQLPEPVDPVVGSDVNWRPTADAAMVHMNHWINGGSPPPLQPTIEIAPGPVPTIVTDEFGNARGGVRLPEVDVPIAHFDVPGGWPPSNLRGSTEALPAKSLRRLYPDRQVYVDLVSEAAQQAHARGVILKRRVNEYASAAEAVRF